jgi:hypothetical protein
MRNAAIAASAPTKRLRVLTSCGSASLRGAFLHDEMLAGPSSFVSDSVVSTQPFVFVGGDVARSLRC